MTGDLIDNLSGFQKDTINKEDLKLHQSQSEQIQCSQDLGVQICLIFFLLHHLCCVQNAASSSKAVQLSFFIFLFLLLLLNYVSPEKNK